MKSIISKMFLLSVLAFSFKHCQAASSEGKVIRLNAAFSIINSGEATGTMVFESTDYPKPVILGGISPMLVHLGDRAELYVDFNCEKNTIVLGSYRADVQGLLNKHKNKWQTFGHLILLNR